MLENLLKSNNMSMYQCAKLSGIPYTTLSELVHGKTKIEKCTGETLYRLAKTLNVSMEFLISDSIENRLDFEIFKSNACHRIKDMGEIDFIVEELQSNNIGRYWSKKWYAESFYLLACVDYLSRINEIPICTKYDYIRNQSLKHTLYPKDIIMSARLNKSQNIKNNAKREAIPEFLRFNIVESEIRNVY